MIQPILEAIIWGSGLTVIVSLSREYNLHILLGLVYAGLNLFGKKLYLSPILPMQPGFGQLYNLRPAVMSMVTSMLNKAFEKVPDSTGLILHSGQSWQYQQKVCQRMPREKSIRQSMSRKGSCLDNAVIENFVCLLKTELLYLQEFESMEQFKQELIEYLDYYNNR